MSQTHVKHPILRLEVVRPDGTSTSDYRVFCRYQKRSVSVGTCCACMHCDQISAEPTPTVDCTIPCRDGERADADGQSTPVAALLHEGTLALDPSATLRDALTTLRTCDRRSVAVVDETHVLVGVVHEAAFVVPRARDGALPADLSNAMSSAVAIHESVPIRHALRLLASAHLREATVVDDQRVPLGVFRDIDGLRWIFEASHSMPPPSDDD